MKGLMKKINAADHKKTHIIHLVFKKQQESVGRIIKGKGASCFAS